MAEFKSNAYRPFTGEIKVLEKEDPFNYRVEVWLLNDEVNRNGWQFKNLDKHRQKFAGTPILTAYVGNTIGDGHNYRLVKDRKTGKERPTFLDATSERIVGSLSENPDDIRLEVRDENTWIVGRGRLWSWYAPELVQKITDDAMQGRDMSVSIETLVTESRMVGKVEIEESYEILGTTILGDHVEPAVKDARIAALRALGGEWEELKIRAAAYMKRTPKNDEKGVRILDMSSKRSLAALQAKFPDHVILQVMGDKICLMSKTDYTLFTYRVLESDKGEIIKDRIAPALVTAAFPFEGGDVSVDVNAITDSLSSSLIELSEKNKGLETSLAERDETIRQLKEAEQKRRRAAIKDALKSALCRFNEDAPDDEKAEDGDAQEIDENAYVDCVDGEGNFCGDKLAADALLAKCAKRVIEARRQRARERKMTFAWEEKGKTKDDGADPIAHIYRSIVG